MSNASTINVDQKRSKLSAYNREINLSLMLYLAVIIFGILYPRSFLSHANIAAILNNVAAEGIIAVGMMLLMISGVFDLSVGSMCSLCGVLAGHLMVYEGWPTFIAVPVALFLAGCGGAINGLLVSKLKVNAMITTLGTMGIFKGTAVLIGGPSISGLPASFTWFGQSTILGIQYSFWFMVLLVGAAHFATNHLRFFRQYYFIGSNERAAKLSGISVERLQWIGFMIMAILAGIAGLSFASRFGAAVSNAGEMKELQVITAVVLGGASLQGGRGNIIGAIIGVIFMAVVANILIISNVSSYWHGIVMGSILIAAVAYDSLQRNKR